MSLQVQKTKDVQIGVRFTRDDYALLAEHAGGKKRVPAYLRGLVHGLRVAQSQQEGREERDDGR